MEEQKNNITIKERLQIFAGGTAVSAVLGVGSMFFHAFPGEPIFILAPMFVSLVNGKPIQEAMLEFRAYLAPNVSKEQFNDIVEKHVESENAHLDQSASAKFQRILSLFSSSSEEQEVVPTQKMLMLGKERKKSDAFSYKEDAEFPPIFTLDLVLEKIAYYNSKSKIYLGVSNEGDIALDVADIYHILHVAKSGRGKSNDMRFIMMQLVRIAQCYCINPMGNNKKRLKVGDPRKYEIWKPIYDRLENGHVVKDVKEIQQLLKHVDNIVRYRVEHEEEDGEWEPIFLFMDEMKAVNDECPKEMQEYLSRIAMTGRQVWVFLFGASQTAYVGDIGLKKGTQSQFQTIIYGGGSPDSMNKLTQKAATDEVEEKLRANKGLRALFIEGEEGFTYMRTPLTTNEAVFDFLGEEFLLSDWEKTIELPSEKHEASNIIRFQFSPQNEQNDDFEDENDENDEMFEQLETENSVDDDIMWCFEAFRSEGKMEANLNQIVTRIKNEFPETMINRNTDEQRIRDLAKEYGFSIVKGPGGARKVGTK